MSASIIAAEETASLAGEYVDHLKERRTTPRIGPEAGVLLTDAISGPTTR